MGKTKKPSLLSPQNCYFVSQEGLLAPATITFDDGGSPGEAKYLSWICLRIFWKYSFPLVLNNNTIKIHTFN